MSNQTTTPRPNPDSYTKKELLEELRARERRLYSGKTARRVRKLTPEKRLDFVTQRNQLTATIRRLTTTAMRDIRVRLERESPVLRVRMAKLEQSLARVEEATQWAKGIRSVLEVLGRVVDLI